MEAKVIIGKTVRHFREYLGLSQEKLAEEAGITYQYLSSVENGKENFTVGILESLSKSLGTAVAPLIAHAYAANSALPTRIRPEYLIKTAPLPPQLTLAHVERALNETHAIIRLINSTLIQVAERPLSAYIQSNNFSGIVSNILCDAFSRFTPYQHNHHQRYPDLVCLDSTAKPLAGLEVKATIRPGKGGESHNGHSGWHIVACFELEREKGDIQFVHVMFAELIGHGKPGADWKYLGSNLNEVTGSRRTETYITTPQGTAKLRHGTVYLNPEKIKITRWRTNRSVPIPSHSLFQIKSNKYG